MHVTYYFIHFFTLNFFQHKQTSTSSKKSCTSNRSCASVFYLNGPWQTKYFNKTSETLFFWPFRHLGIKLKQYKTKFYKKIFSAVVLNYFVTGLLVICNNCQYWIHWSHLEALGRNGLQFGKKLNWKFSLRTFWFSALNMFYLNAQAYLRPCQNSKKNSTTDVWQRPKYDLGMYI